MCESARSHVGDPCSEGRVSPRIHLFAASDESNV